MVVKSISHLPIV